MIGLALRMLFGERAKFTLLLSGLCCSSLLMLLGISLGLGIISMSHATVDNVRSPIWVVDPTVDQVNDSQPLRETDVGRVRSVDGVAWAVPLHLGPAQVRLLDTGVGKIVELVGLDTTTLFGAPSRILKGSLADLRLPDAVIVDERATTLLSSNPSRPLKVGDTFEMNDRRAIIVGVCFAKLSFGRGPYVFTTYNRAVQFIPGQRKMVTHILVVPDAGRDLHDVTRAITVATGLQAVTEDELKGMTVRWLLDNDPAPVAIAIIIAVGFIIGTIVSGQTFYSFVFENSRYLGALRAMGTETRTLAWMILMQVLVVGFVGFGLGLGSTCGLFLLVPEGKIPFLMLWPAPVGVFGAIVVICLFAALLGIRRVAKLEPAIVFRG